MKRLLLSLVATTTISLLPYYSLSAQVRGRALGEFGRPIEGAVIELWSGTTLLHATRSTESGNFNIPGPISPGVVRLLARAIGYRPASIQLHEITEPITLTLKRQAHLLPEVRIESPQVPCKGVDDPLARRLLERVSARYSADHSSSYFSRLRASRNVVSEADVGVFDTVPELWGERGTAGSTRMAWRDLIKREGYAWSPKGDLGGRFDLWNYPLLDADFASHFTDSLFRDLQNFSMISREASATTIAFCSKDRRRPRISGWIEVASDSTLIEAAWSFTVPKHDEGAGGRVIFAPRTTSQRIPTLAAAGLFWRRLPVRGYLQETQYFTEWKLSPLNSRKGSP